LCGGFGFWGVVCTVTVCVQARRSASAFTPASSGERRRGGSLASSAIIRSRREFARRKARQRFPAAAASAMADARAAHSRARTRGIPPAPEACGRAAPPQPAVTSTTRVAAVTNLDTFPLLPAIRPNVASHSRPRTVKVLLMPMLHGCAFPGCSTFTLSTYCVEHELLVRALKESERTHTASLDEHLEDAAMSADPAGERQEPATF